MSSFKYLIIIIIGLILSTGIQADAQVDNPTTDLIMDPISVIAEMNRNGTTSITIQSTVINQGEIPTNDISFRLESLDITLLLAEFNGNPVPAIIERMERHSMIQITLSDTLNSGDSGQLHLQVSSEDIQSPLEVATDGETLQGGLVYYMRPHITIANFTFTAILPEYTSLSDESLVPIFPNSDSNYTNGKSVVFVWKTNLLQPGQERAYIIHYQTDYTSPISNVLSPSLILFLLLLGTLLGTVITYLQPRIANRINSIGKVEYLGTTSEEEEILSIIREKGGSCSQKELYQRLPISESKVSLLLGNLEERGAIRRFREGRENMIYLIE